MSTDAATTHEIRDGWERLAARFDEHTTPLTMAFAAQLLDRLDIGPGVRLLDVACGSGALSIPAARRGAQVTGVDLAPAMIERLAARARAEGLDTVEARVMDGTALGFADATFDVAVSLNGVSLFPDVGGGLAEMARVLQPGGWALVAAFGPPDTVEFLGYFLAALQAAVPGFTPPPTDPPPPPFQLADPQTFRQRLTAAGLGDVRVEPVTWEMPFASAAHFWDVVTNSNPLGAALVADLTDQQRADARQVADGMLRERSQGRPEATLIAEMNVGLGRR